MGEARNVPASLNLLSAGDPVALPVATNKQKLPVHL